MNYILFDVPKIWNDLLPLTYTRPVSELRIGISTIKEKWDYFLKTKTSYLTEAYLQEKFPMIVGDSNVYINSSIVPSANLIAEIMKMTKGSALLAGDTLIAVYSTQNVSGYVLRQDLSKFSVGQLDADYIQIKYPWDIFSFNGKVMENDFHRLLVQRNSAFISESNHIINRENIFIEEGATVEFATLNAQDGYIYIGKDAKVFEGVLVRGSLALLDHSELKLGAKVYGPTTIGPQCKVGGENNNVVYVGYANKAHDGFLGNAVIGEWCNIGADTNNSNLKNNYAEVKMWNYPQQRFIKTGLQFCGLIMGDHSKCAINTMFNTGTVVGVSANIFGSGFPRNFIPSFTWGGPHGFTEYDYNKAMEVTKIVMARRNIELSEVEFTMLKAVFDNTSVYRK